jgi:hypothetical protein
VEVCGSFALPRSLPVPLAIACEPTSDTPVGPMPMSVPATVVSAVVAIVSAEHPIPRVHPVVLSVGPLDDFVRDATCPAADRASRAGPLELSVIRSVLAVLRATVRARLALVSVPAPGFSVPA